MLRWRDWRGICCCFFFSRGDWKEFSNHSLFSRKQLGHYEGQTERSLTSSARSLQCVKTCKASTRAGEEDFDGMTLTSELSHGEQTWFPLYRKTTWVSEGSARSFSPFLFPRWENEEAATSKAVIIDPLVSQCVCVCVWTRSWCKKKKTGLEDTEGISFLCPYLTSHNLWGVLRAFLVFFSLKHTDEQLSSAFRQFLISFKDCFLSVEGCS